MLRRQARVLVQPALRTPHHPLVVLRLHACAAIAAEPVVTCPDADLAGIAEHAELIEIAVQHELPQRRPGHARQLDRLVQFQHVDRLALPMADPMFGEQREFLALQPFAGNSRPLSS